jgi:hypothetical protein
MNLSNEDNEIYKIYYRVVDANRQKVGEDKSPYWAHMLAVKCFDHSLTTIYLKQGTSIPEIHNKVFIDFSTFHVAIRSAFESLLTFAYMFTLPNDKSESDLREPLKIDCRDEMKAVKGRMRA